MEKKGSVLIVLLALTVLWDGIAAQNFDALNKRLLQANAYEMLFPSDVDHATYRQLLEKVTKSFEGMQTFWFEPQLLSEGDEPRNISEECNAGAAKIMNMTDPVTHLSMAVRMVDAMGKIGPGYFDGNFHASGSYDECLDIGPGDAEYCMGQLNITINNLTQPLSWIYSLCVPRGCTPADVALGIETVTFGLVKTKADGLYCVSTKRPPYKAGSIIMIVVCFVFGALVVGASVFDLFLQRLSTTDDTTANQIQGDEVDKSQTQLTKKYRYIEFIVAFSLFKVVPQILSMKQPPSAITCINGLRVISMLWVILGHTHLIALVTGLDNPFMLKDVLSRFTFQAVGNAYFAVDSFFVLSGLLVAYLSMRQMKRKNGRFPFLSYYLHRYLRLTPTYAFVLFFIWLVGMHFTDGPNFSLVSWDISSTYKNCEKYWWTNLLYINNFYPWKLGDECVDWSWYLANDMQFYVLAPLIISPLYFIVPIGLVISCVVIVISMLISGVLAGVYDHQANQLAFYAYGYVSNTTEDTQYQNLLYIKPWHRVGPYIVGLLLGYVLYRLRLPTGKQYRYIKYFVFSILWALSAVFLISTLYGLYSSWHGEIPTKAENVSYITFSKFTWSLGLSFVIIGCHYGYGGLVNWFLSMKIWIPLSRLSYNAYLLHPFILMVVYGSERKSLYYQDYNMVVYFIGVAVISYGAAAVVSVFVEFPIGNLEQACFKMAGIGGRESARTGGEDHKTAKENFCEGEYQKVGDDEDHSKLTEEVDREKSPLLSGSYKTNRV